MIPTWLTDLIPLAPWLVVLILLGMVVRLVWPYARKLGHFIDDVAGEPARPGVDARPGLMERVQRIEHELTTNHGSSLKDAVQRMERRLDEHLGPESQMITDLHEKYVGTTKERR